MREYAKWLWYTHLVTMVAERHEKVWAKSYALFDDYNIISSDSLYIIVCITCSHFHLINMMVSRGKKGDYQNCSSTYLSSVI